MVIGGYGPCAGRDDERVRGAGLVQVPQQVGRGIQLWCGAEVGMVIAEVGMLIAEWWAKAGTLIIISAKVAGEYFYVYCM